MRLVDLMYLARSLEGEAVGWMLGLGVVYEVPWLDWGRFGEELVGEESDMSDKRNSPNYD